MDFDLLIQRKRERFEQLEREIADPSLFENREYGLESIGAWGVKGSDFQSERRVGFSKIALREWSAPGPACPRNRGAGTHSYQHRHGRGLAGGGGNRSGIKTGRDSH